MGQEMEADIFLTLRPEIGKGSPPPDYIGKNSHKAYPETKRGQIGLAS